jgi:hypothetical protein
MHFRSLGSSRGRLGTGKSPYGPPDLLAAPDSCLYSSSVVCTGWHRPDLNTAFRVSTEHCRFGILEAGLLMTAHSELEREDLIEALKANLHALCDLRHVPHNDLHVLRLKRHLRTKIAELDPSSGVLSLRASA